MTRLTLLALLAPLFVPTPAEAQRVTGLEMSIEGSLQAVQGEEQLLLVTLHALSDDELRPAAGAALKVTASYRADGPIAELRTDRHGRAAIRYTPEGPDDLEIVIDAFHGGASRRFRVPVRLDRSASLHLEALPARAEPAAPVLIFGHALDPGGVPAGAGREVRLVVPGSEPVVARTDADGAFAARVEAPATVGAVQVRGTLEPLVREGERRLPGASAQVALTVAERAVRRGLRARGVPRRPIVAPRAPIAVDVEVRDGLGRPVRATVTRIGADAEPVRADERGLATFEWRAPSVTGIHDQVARFRVELAGEAPIEERVTIRVASVPAAAEVVPTGGALVPGVPSQLLVRAVRADGRPYAGPVTLRAARFGAATLTTDAEGYGSAAVTLSETPITDACGGVSALAVEVELDGAAGQARCVPIDPDASVRVEVEEREGRLHLRLHRRAAVRRAPAVVTVFRMRGGALVPLSASWVSGEAATLERPAPGPLWVRARLRVGRAEAEVRGAFAHVAGPPAPSVRVEGAAAAGEGSIASVLAPAASVARFERRHRAPDALAVARSVPRDLGAPFRLVRGELAPAEPLDEPVALAILRDPWRQRALYRSGRLALLFRALEEKVAEATEDELGLDRLTHVARGRRRFNAGVLQLLDRSGELGPEGARDLGGEPLTIARLQAMDRAFDFDAVARRVTRKRLVELLAAWRPWVHESDLDPAFAPHADPRHWWSTFCETHGWVRDGWGRPFRLTRGERAEGAPVVVPGWTITSAGPDGRFETRDDLRDPFARTVPPGVYAEAVGEEALVQALRRGVLDRETVRLLNAGSLARGAQQTALAGLPRPIELEPPPFLVGSVPISVRLGEAPHETRLPPASEPHRLLALAFGGPRGVGTASAPIAASEGARIAILPPARLHGGTALSMPVVVVAGERAEGLTLVARAEGARVSLGDGALGDLLPGRAKERTLRVEASPDHARTTILLTLERDGAPVVERRISAPIVDGLPERTLFAADATEGSWPVRYPVPPDAVGARTRLVVTAPGRVDADPRLAYGPVARAWARLMAGEGDAVHLGDLPATTDDPVDAARLALLTTALGEQRRRSHHAERVLAERVRGLDAAGRARVLAVLSSLALPRFADAEAGPAGTAHALRQQLWSEHQTEGAALARTAAALLLADPEDPQGRAAFVRARRAMEGAGAATTAQVVPAEDPREQLAASVALALAAHVAGDGATRDRLLRGLGRRIHLAADRRSDAAFWLLTAAAHGTFGRAEGSARLRTAEGTRALTFEDGLATAAIDTEDEVRLELETSGGVHLARLETRYGRPVPDAEASPLRVAIEGVAGRAGRRAGYELRVGAVSPVARPVIALTLPPGAELEPSALAALAAVSGVHAVEAPDTRGVVRLELRPLAAEEEHRVPLPLRWAGAGEREGLAVAAWERARPWEVTSIPPRAIDVRP